MVQNSPKRSSTVLNRGVQIGFLAIKSNLKSNQEVKNYVKSNYDQIKSCSFLFKSSNQIIKSNSLNTPMGVQIGFLEIKSNLKSNQGFGKFSNQTSNQITVPKNLSNQTTNQIRLFKRSSNQISNQTTSQQT